MANSRIRVSWIVLGTFLVGSIAGSVITTTYSQERNLTGEGMVTGIGGIFFRSEDPGESRRWYRENLGISGEGEGVNYFWRERDDPDVLGFTVWSIFSSDTDYFGPSQQEFMINYRVQNLDALLAPLSQQGVEQVGGIDEYSYGRFAWIVDVDGRRIELWEPTDISTESL